MRAVVQEGYGSPDVLRLQDVECPSPGDDQVLVEVQAASVNALDWHFTRGMPYLVRLDSGFRSPKDRVRGVDLAGTVAAVGKNVTRFKVGDEVFGGSNGSFAEFTVTTEMRLAPKPPQLGFGEAASLHVAAMTALQGLKGRAGVRSGHRVAIHGAGGGVGIMAVQIAKWLGAHVTAITRAESVEMVRSLGADEVIDHSKDDFTRRSARYDVLFDIGGRRPFTAYRRVMTTNGTIVAVGGPAGRWLEPAGRMLKALTLSPFVSQRILPFMSVDDAASLNAIADLARAGTLRTVIDRSFVLEEAAEAIRYVGEGNPRGKVIIRISRGDSEGSHG